jgi:hypothetical protein
LGARKTSFGLTDTFFLTSTEWIDRGEFTPKGHAAAKRSVRETRKYWFSSPRRSAAAESTAEDGVNLPAFCSDQLSEGSDEKTVDKTC